MVSQRDLLTSMWLNVFMFFLASQNVVDTFGLGVSEEEWNPMEDLSGGEFETDESMPAFRDGVQVRARAPAPLRLPQSLRIPASALRKDLFTPEKGTRPIPEEVKAMLLPPFVSPPKTPTSVKKLELLCRLDSMNVRVRKSVFSDPKAWKYLKMGTCVVSKASRTHYYFMYPLKSCSIKRMEDPNHVSFMTNLYYNPPVTGLVVRDLPFTIPVRCQYNKFHRSYRVGFRPKVMGGTMYRGLQSRPNASLVAMDESWQLLPVGKSFMLGQPICFEATGPNGGADRMYLNSCYVTPTQNITSTDRYVVVENSGCLVDSKNSPLTKYYNTSAKTTVRLCFAAFLFKNLLATQTQQTMFMHCELFVAPDTPTPSSKSCTYDLQTNKWTELYGDSSVCNCCETSCPPPSASAKSIVTSKSWDLKRGREPLKVLEAMPELFPSGDDMELYWDTSAYDHV